MLVCNHPHNPGLSGKLILLPSIHDEGEDELYLADVSDLIAVTILKMGKMLANSCACTSLVDTEQHLLGVHLLFRSLLFTINS